MLCCCLPKMAGHASSASSLLCLQARGSWSPGTRSGLQSHSDVRPVIRVPSLQGARLCTPLLWSEHYDEVVLGMGQPPIGGYGDMRLTFLLPGVRREEISLPLVCPYEDCQGVRLRLHQRVAKYLNDTVCPEVTAHRYQCLTCGRTFRVYPTGVSNAQTSVRVKRVAAILYLLGLSYGETTVALETLGVYVSKSQVYYFVQEMMERVPGLSRRSVLQDVWSAALDDDPASERSSGEWLPLRLTVHDPGGTVLTVDAIQGEDADTLKARMAPIAEAVGATLSVSDGVDALERLPHSAGARVPRSAGARVANGLDV